MDEPRKTVSDVNQAGVNFLIVDLETALVFLDTAEASRQAETVERCLQNARKAYDTVLGFVERIQLTQSEREAVNSHLNIVRGRLTAAGQDF